MKKTAKVTIEVDDQDPMVFDLKELELDVGSDLILKGNIVHQTPRHVTIKGTIIEEKGE